MMRKSTLATVLVLAGASAAACGGEAPPPAAPPASSAAPAAPAPASTAEATPAPASKKSLADLVPETLKNVTDAVNAHDAAKFAANFAPDAVVTVYGGPEAHGRDELTKMIQQFFDMSGDVKGGAEHLWAKGNQIAVDWVSVGTMTGDFMGMKASKKPFGEHRLVIA